MPKKSFSLRVLDAVKKIPRGKVLTYKEVAQRAGNKKAFRAAGNILGQNHDPEIPCHRVIRANGQIGGYNRGKRRKKQLLAQEGYRAG